MAISPRLLASIVSSATVGSVRLVSAKTSELTRAVFSSFMVFCYQYTLSFVEKIIKFTVVLTLAADLDRY